ncbi:glycoside hydrolase family 28 protein [Pedobacter frigidisoli]|uniref:Glycoside hydrolase family 28 protein n=1 Tax=Pedobacter frigidisoli TaxID=2530455 RepID=A0A4V2MME0_9SPHI|nr:right-handed parallel beta-helix repeat-containing protein [Pedobacter frigidisoli]TCD05897.1 glycoside hydrolase family 28 protein [Pedobacter frigidisoli]
MLYKNIRVLLTPALLLLTVCQVMAQGQFYNVKKYGAKGNGKNLDTKAINLAIETASLAGGGTVYFPAGDYLSVTIHLKSNIALYIDQGATIVAAATTETVKYDLPEKGENEIYQDFGHSHFQNSLIVGIDLQNISITGPGRIWGKGLIREDGINGVNNGYGNKTLALKRCRNVILKDFTVEKGGWFGFLLTAVDNATIDNIKMDTNRDGIDLISSKNVRISNCSINSPGDDAIVLKSDYALNYPRVTENITITNCQVSGYDDGTFLDGTFQKKGRKNPTGRIKIGTESNGGFKNIAITNCIFDHCRGLAIETVDGAVLEDIVISNLTMRDITNAPIFIRLGARQRGPEGSPFSILQRVMISNVIAYDVTGEQGAIISGIPGHDIDDLTLNNISFYFKGGGTSAQALNEIPPLIDSYPDPNRFGITPAYGFFIRNVKNLKMNNIRVSYIKPDFRPAFVLDNVTGADFQQIRVDQIKGTPVFNLKTVKNLSLSNSHPISDTQLSEVDEKQL